MTMGQVDNDSMMSQQQELTQPMIRLSCLETVESFVSPLRTEENEASSAAKPLVDLSIMDLKARKERLQQMIRDIELRDEQVREQQVKLQLSQQQLEGEVAITAPADHPMVVQTTPSEASAPVEAEEASAPSEALAPIEEESTPEEEALAPIAEEEESPEEEEEEEQTTPIVDAEPEEAAAAAASAATAEEASPTAEEASPTAEEASPAAEEASPAAEETSPTAEETSPAAEEASPTAEEASPAAEETSPVVAPVVPADPEPPVSVESTTNSPQQEQQEQVLLRPIKSAFRTGDAFAKPASPRHVFFDLSAVQVYQDFRALPELPFKEDDFDDNVHVDEDNNDDDDNDLCEEVVEDDDDEEVWEEEVIEDDDVVHLAPPPSPTTSSFTVSPPTWEDRERFAKKLYDMRDAEDNTSVTDDSTVSDMRSDTSFGSPISNRFEEQQQQHEQHAYQSHSPPPPPSRRPLSPPCTRRFSLAQPLSQPLSAGKQERRMSMPSSLPKKKKTSVLSKLATKTNICSSTGKELPTPTVLSPQTLPSDSASYPTVSLSFLAQNLTTSVAIKVMEEALRILMPGGILYVFDVEGAAVKMLPDELRDLLVRVPYAGVKQTVHEIQTQEIMRNHGYVDLFPREDLIVRWMAVKPSANYTVELA